MSSDDSLDLLIKIVFNNNIIEVVMPVEEFDDEIISLTQSLLEMLNLTVPGQEISDYSFLKTDTFYIEIFKAILDPETSKFDEDEFNRETEGLSGGERIQLLIKKLDTEILNIDLDHIKGEKIAKGDKKHITNMLQLLNALSQNLKQKQHHGDGKRGHN
jgi:hypothetical protein